MKDRVRVSGRGGRFVSAALWLLAAPCMGNAAAPLDEEMKRLGVRSALVIASEAVDESPVWSPAGDALAVNIEGRWGRVDLGSVALEPGTWRDKQPIGVLNPPASLSRIEEGTVEKWKKSGTYGARKVVMPDGTTVELRQDELSTKLVVTKRDAKPKTLWTSGFENCHSLALSPDGHYVAYICELNGVVVTEP